MAYVSLNRAAEKFKAHPRTLLRAISGEPNPYWTEDWNPDINIEDLCKAYNCKEKMLNKVFQGKEDLLTPAEAVDELGIPDRTFRYRKYPNIKNGGIVRYVRSKMLQIHFTKWEE